MKKILTYILFLAATYVIAALLVFSIRHPWATQMECLLSIDKVMEFETIEYDEMRPR